VAKTFIDWFDVAAIGLVLRWFAVRMFQLSVKSKNKDVSLVVQFFAGTL